MLSIARGATGGRGVPVRIWHLVAVLPALTGLEKRWSPWIARAPVDLACRVFARMAQQPMLPSMLVAGSGQARLASW